MLTEVDTQRRLHLLLLILVPLFALTLLALPFAIQADLSSSGAQSTIQTGIGLICFALGVWAVRRRWVNVAAFSLFAGVTGVIVLLLMNDGVFGGPLALRTIPAFALLVLPITIAGVFGEARTVLLTTLAAAGFTLAGILLTPHGPDVQAALSTPDGLVIFTVPISTQLALGVLVLAATRSYRHTQRELVDLRVAYAREKELDRLKDQFISSVNHELRTPIMALQGYIALAREFNTRGDAERQEALLARGAEAAEHLAGLVTSVLNVRRVEADAHTLQPVVCALHPIVVAATNLLDPRDAGAQERPLRLHVPQDLTVYADPDRLRQILLNLLSNACKYSPSGSPVEVSAHTRVPAPAAHRWSRPETEERPMIEVSIRDYGEGIPPDQAVLLFQRFVRLERDIASSVTGTGLGLAICRTYIEAMGGRIWIESTGVPGEGTSFIFTLPCAPAVSQPSPTSPLPAADEPAGPA